MSKVAVERVLEPPKPGAAALAGAEAPPPKAKGPGVVDAAGISLPLDAAAAVESPPAGMPLLGLVAPGLGASVTSALLGLELLSAGPPKLKVVVGTAAGPAAGTEGAAGAGAVAGPKLKCPSEAAGPDCCPACAAPAAQTAES